ncbi:hypothetical protein U1708_17615 [Sphingomonas sp. ZB1N12]|jgi:hypothetical protein|uniref:hypothetical protein n=1 Tax=Sphingomonas TaxID=13687 RepID=UPI0013568735|nr:hypothetical protein [Sphingomonas sp. T1]
MTMVKGEAGRPVPFFAERAQASNVDPMHRPELSGQTLVDFLDSELLDGRHDTLEVGTIGLEQARLLNQLQAFRSLPFEELLATIGKPLFFGFKLLPFLFDTQCHEVLNLSLDDASMDQDASALTSRQ